MYNDFYLDYYQLFHHHKLEKCQVFEYRLLDSKTVTAKFEDGSFIYFASKENIVDSKDIIIINSNEKDFKKIMHKTIFYHEKE